MDATTGIRMMAAMMALGTFVVMLAIAVFYILTISKTLQKCAPQSRTMQPGMAWMLLVPLVNLIWNFLVVNAISDSLTNEFRLRGIQNFELNPGKSIGMPMAICGACSIIPILGVLAALAYLVLWIVYWIKVSSFSKMLDQVPAGMTPMNTPTY